MPWRTIFHWGPLSALFIILFLFVTVFYNVLIFFPPVSLGYLLHILSVIVETELIVYYFLSASIVGPGYTQLNWKPKDYKDAKFLQFCKICDGYKVPRSHHCRKCQRCVLKMDHHCPWINTCVGHDNHYYFVVFLFLVPLFTFHALAVLVFGCYDIMFTQSFITRAAIFDYTITLFICSLMGSGICIGCIATVGFLFVTQFIAILRNQTGIEDWIVHKAKARRQTSGEAYFYPYDLGKYKNFMQWLHPGDGITWNVRQGCNQYSLTMEQLEQKQLKRDRSVEFEVIKYYNGACCPITQGIRVLWAAPWTDENRIPINIGDIFIASRGRKHWIYGDRIVDGKTLARGWVLRNCVRKCQAFDKKNY